METLTVATIWYIYQVKNICRRNQPCTSFSFANAVVQDKNGDLYTRTSILN